MDPFAKHSASMAALERRMGAGCQSITWPVTAGKVYPCLGGSDGGVGKLLGVGGFAVDGLRRVVIRAELFGAGPQPQEQNNVLFKANQADTATKLRIKSITPSPDKSLLMFELVPPNKGVG